MKLSLLFVTAALSICSAAYGQEVTETDTLLYFGPPQLVDSHVNYFDFLSARLTADKFAIVLSHYGAYTGYQTVKRAVIVRPDSIDFSVTQTSNHIGYVISPTLISLDTNRVIFANYNSSAFGSVTQWQVSDTAITQQTEVPLHTSEYEYKLNRLNDSTFVVFLSQFIAYLDSNAGTMKNARVLRYMIGSINDVGAMVLSNETAVDTTLSVNSSDPIQVGEDEFLFPLDDGGYHSAKIVDGKFVVSEESVVPPTSIRNGYNVWVHSNKLAVVTSFNGNIGFSVFERNGLQFDSLSSIATDLPLIENTFKYFFAQDTSAFVGYLITSGGNRHLCRFRFNESYTALTEASHRYLGSEESVLNVIALDEKTLAVGTATATGYYVRLASHEDQWRSILVANDSLNFGEVFLDSVVTASFTVRNTGHESLMVNNITVPEGYTVDWTDGEIPANGSQVVNISFAPTFEQTYGGGVDIESNAGFESVQISISGIGKQHVFTGIESPDNEKVSIYPNPTATQATILSHTPVRTFGIYSINGKQILTGKSNIINLERVHAGLYFVRVVLDNRTEVLKLFVVSSPD